MCYLPKNYDHNTLTSGIFQEEIDLSTTMLRFHLANFFMFFAWASGSLQKKFK